MSPRRTRGIATAMVIISCSLLLALGYYLRQGPGDSSDDRNTSLAPSIATHNVDGNYWVVSRLDKDAYLKDLARTTKQITLKPSLGKESDEVVDLSVMKVAEESPMYAAGFRKDDRILKVNGTPIGTMQRAVNLVHEIKACDTLTVQVQRGDQVIDYRFDFK